MTDTMQRYSTRGVRRCIWQFLREHILPLMLTLLIISLPLIASAVLNGIAQESLLEVQEEKAHLRELVQIPGWKDVPENKDVIINAWVRESEVESKATTLSIIASCMRFATFFFAMPLLPGVNRTLISMLRGDNICWRDARFTFAEFCRGVKLQCCILVMMLYLSVPQVMLHFLANTIDGGSGEVGGFLNILGRLVTCVLTSLALLRYQLAPHLLAINTEGSSLELITRSAEILDNRSLLPQLSILFPGLLILLGVHVLSIAIPEELLPATVAGVLKILLFIPSYAYLLVGSAAIFVTFRQE